jgi:LPXTG-motif cell wall-anchored protein
MDQTSRRRYVLAGLASMGAGAVMLVAALPGTVGAAPQQQATPSTSVVPGNPTCGDLAPQGASWTELKVEPVEDGTFDDGVLVVTIDVTDTADGQVVNWTSNIGVDAVFVKGGPNGTLYLYDPPAESTGDTGLHAPVNPNNDKFFGLSHISFCYDEDQATTSTTEEETTSTTGEETTSTIAGTISPNTNTTTLGGELPETGSTVGPMMGIGAALLLGGGLMLAYARRLRAT